MEFIPRTEPIKNNHHVYTLKSKHFNSVDTKKAFHQISHLMPKKKKKES